MPIKKVKTKKQIANQRRIDREWRAKERKSNPIKYQWQRLRWRAKQRNKTCGITLQEFTEWCLSNNYHLLAGLYAGDMTIDRICNEIGYENGNIRMTQRTYNSSKGVSDRDIPYEDDRPIDTWKPNLDIESF